MHRLLQHGEASLLFQLLTRVVEFFTEIPPFARFVPVPGGKNSPVVGIGDDEVISSLDDRRVFSVTRELMRGVIGHGRRIGVEPVSFS